MYIKVINPQKHGSIAYKNTGSCQRLVNYLNKENMDKNLEERELFFNQNSDNISSNTVVQTIDNNKKGVAKGRAVFHSLVIAPDKEELNHIKHSPSLLKSYTTRVMEQYVANFRLQNNQTLSINDLVWFGKLEFYRNNAYDNHDNMHVHIIVSTRDANQKISLSPNTNDKSRFNRVNFALNSEKAFDFHFGYKRDSSRLYQHQIRMHGSISERISMSDFHSHQEEQMESREQDHFSSLNIPITTLSSVTNDDTQKKKSKKKRKKRNPNKGLALE
jgi:hypothetical protein